MIAHCGLICTECPAYLATRNDDQELRAKTAAEWSKMFKSEIKPQDINCDGCLSQSAKLFGYCGVCAVRRCGQEKGLENCAPCPDYPCPELTEILDFAPSAKKVLEEIRAGVRD